MDILAAEYSLAQRQLTVVVSGQSHALPADRLLEVIRLPRSTRVPHGPPALVGVFNLRGGVFPLISLARLMSAPEGAEQRALLLDHGGPRDFGHDPVGPPFGRRSHGWMNNAQFAAAFALSQIAPGPNILLMTLIGWRVAGLTGLVVASLATIIPTSAMALMAGRGEKRLQHARWYAMTKRSLPPLVVGLICASALITAQAAIHEWLGVALAVGVAVHVAVSRTNPLIPLFAAVAVGVIAGRLGIY